ncbi:Zinc finger protein [Plakobranchus ocellatus]|uniref:Zinc finger protein n=1 Tax=Plakobranchus ocellatus TaxID=259542 RepID=A0AAV3Z2Q5_9GAST|nr:Zinc finger protein [Plakobranchus ocellatus]
MPPSRHIFAVCVVSSEQPRQWHRYINPLLSASREVLQESTYFAPSSCSTEEPYLEGVRDERDPGARCRGATEGLDKAESLL